MSKDAFNAPPCHLAASALSLQWKDSETFVILDAPFSLDRLSTVATAFDRTPGQCRRIEYLTVCPIGTPAPRLSSNAPPEWASLAAELSKEWPMPLPGTHSVTLREGRIHLILAFGENRDQVPMFDALCDAILLEGPTQPPPSALARLVRRGSTVVLQNGSPEMAGTLSAAGFEITQLLPDGSLSGRFRVEKRTRGRASLQPCPEHRSALVIGAGLAGTAVASALARRHWNVSILEKNSAPGAGASGNLAAVFSPLLSLDDGRASRLSRACFLRLLQELRSLDHRAFPALWKACGVLQLPKSHTEEAHFRNLALQLAYPERYVRFLEKRAAEERVCQVLPSGGWFFEEGGWVNPPSLCAARIHNHPRITPLYEQDVHSLLYGEGNWSVLGPRGESIASAPVLVLANAGEAAQLVPHFQLPFKRVRGQVAHLPEGSVPNPGLVLSKDGYLTPPVLGSHCLGATYDFGSDEQNLTADAHAKNLERLPQILPEGLPPAPDPVEGRVGFRSLTPDRIPVAGPLFSATATPYPCGEPGGELPTGLYCLLGLGSRGLVWSSLLGEYVAALIDGAPSPLPFDLAAHLSPERFAPSHALSKKRVPPPAPPRISD